MSIGEGFRSAQTLFWVTTKYKLLKTVAKEDSTSKLRNSTQNIAPFFKEYLDVMLYC